MTGRRRVRGTAPRSRFIRRAGEAVIQRAVIDHLRQHGAPGLLYLAIKNEGKRSVVTGHEMKRQGLRPGAADLLLIWPGAPPLFLELKTDSGRQTAEQKRFADDAMRAGARYEIANGIDEALGVLHKVGALKGRMWR